MIWNGVPTTTYYALRLGEIVHQHEASNLTIQLQNCPGCRKSGHHSLKAAKFFYNSRNCALNSSQCECLTYVKTLCSEKLLPCYSCQHHKP